MSGPDPSLFLIRIGCTTARGRWEEALGTLGKRQADGSVALLPRGARVFVERGDGTVEIPVDAPGPAVRALVETLAAFATRFQLDLDGVSGEKALERIWHRFLAAQDDARNAGFRSTKPKAEAGAVWPYAVGLLALLLAAGVLFSRGCPGALEALQPPAAER